MTRQLGNYTLDVNRDDRGRIVAEVWHIKSGKTLGITEVDSEAEAVYWAKRSIRLAGGGHCSACDGRGCSSCGF